MKTICIVDDYANSKVNGIGTYIRELIQTLQTLDVEVWHICICSDSEKLEIEVDNNIKRFLIPPIPYLHSKNCFVFEKLLRLHIKDSSKNLFMFNYNPHKFLVRLIRNSYPLSKISFTIHDMNWTFRFLGNASKFKKDWGNKNLDSEFIKSIESEIKTLSIVDKIIVLAQETKDLLIDTYYIDAQKMYLIPNGKRDSYSPLSKKDIIKLKCDLNIDPNEKIILFAGRINKVKGFSELLNSFKSVVKEYSNCRLVIAGTIFSQDIMETIEDIATKVSFIGQASQERLRNWYNIADIGVLPSYIEQCSYTGIEMMMHSLPIVASDGFGVKEMFINNDNAIVANINNRNNPKEFEINISNAIITLLDSDQLRSGIGTKAREKYKKKYKIENFIDNYRMLINEL